MFLQIVFVIGVLLLLLDLQGELEAVSLAHQVGSLAGVVPSVREGCYWQTKFAFIFSLDLVVLGCRVQQ